MKTLPAQFRGQWLGQTGGRGGGGGEVVVLAEKFTTLVRHTTPRPINFALLFPTSSHLALSPIVSIRSSRAADRSVGTGDRPFRNPCGMMDAQLPIYLSIDLSEGGDEKNNARHRWFISILL